MAVPFALPHETMEFCNQASMRNKTGKAKCDLTLIAPTLLRQPIEASIIPFVNREN